MRDLIERKQIMLNGKKIWAQVPRKLTPEEKAKVHKELLEDIKKIAQISQHRKAA